MKTQMKINAMHKGDVNIIKDCIVSNSPILLLNAIMAGTKRKLHDDNFIKGVKDAENSDETLMGIPLKKVAAASLHLLGVKKYSGNDETIKTMIDTEFGL